jgi:hypothetical protein
VDLGSGLDADAQSKFMKNRVAGIHPLSFAPSPKSND